MSEKKKNLDAKAVIGDIKAGMSDSQLKKKYKLSDKGLESLFGKLRKAGLISEAQLNSRVETDIVFDPESKIKSDDKDQIYVPPPSAGPVEFKPKHAMDFQPAVSLWSPQSAEEPPALEEKPKKKIVTMWRCPACGVEQEQEYDECPRCGVVVAKYSQSAGQIHDPYRAPIAGRQGYTEPQFDDEPEKPDSQVPVILGVAGAIIIIGGLFSPLVKVPFAGGVNLFDLNKIANGAGIIGMALGVAAVLSAVFSVQKRYSFLWATGGACFLAIGVLFWRVKSGISLIKTQMAGAKSAFSQFGSQLQEKLPQVNLEALANQVTTEFEKSFKMDWGWAVFFLGATVILAAALVGSFSQSSD